jgi:hypothetical protein
MEIVYAFVHACMTENTKNKNLMLGSFFTVVWLTSRVVDPDWIRIQRLCGSGSVLGIRIPDPGARKLRNISVKMHFLVIFKKNFITIKV